MCAAAEKANSFEPHSLQLITDGLSSPTKSRSSSCELGGIAIVSVGAPFIRLLLDFESSAPLSSSSTGSLGESSSSSEDR